MSNKYPGGIITSGASVGSSVAFDGNGDYLQVGSNAAFNFSASDCTIECWFFAATTPGSETEIVEFGTGLTSGDIQLIWDSGGQFTFGGSGQTKNRYTFPSGRWYYLAAVKSGVNWYLYIDGVQYVTQTSGAASSSNYVNIGSRNASGNWVTGNIYNLRISNVARYSGATAAMANVLTTDANTKLLTCVGRTITDLSGNNFAITVGGNAYMSSYGPPGYQGFNPALGAAAPGIWTLNQAQYYQGNRLWPIYDPYFKNTTLLLHGNGTNGAQNNTFLDSSTNNFTITRNGNTTQGSFSPFSQTGWSTYFPNSSSQGLTLPSGGLGSGDFTLEYWMYPSSLYDYITSFSTTRGATGFNVGTDSAGLLVWYSSGARQIAAGKISANQWHHAAFVRSGNTLTGYLNGVAVASATVTTNFSATSASIGSLDGGSEYLTGYLSNFRIVVGTAVYTSNFTPPSAPLTAITNTRLLTCQSNRFVDNSSNALALTINGTPSAQAFSPFVPTYSTPITYSNYFNGTTGYLSIPNSSAFAFGTGNFTVEFWMATTDTAGGIAQVTGGTTGYWQCSLSGSQFVWQNARDASNLIVFNIASYLNNSFNHYAFVRSGSTNTLYINGISVATATDSTNYSGTAGNLQLGIDTNPNYLAACISNFRIVKGTAVYTANFTPPTGPLTNITNTSLLTCQSSTFIDNSSNAFTITANGNVQPVASPNPFGFNVDQTTMNSAYTPALQGGSGYFDGTDDYLNTPSSTDFGLGTNDFAFETWVFPTAAGTGNGVIWDNRSSNLGFVVLFSTGNVFRVVVGAGTIWDIDQSTSAVPLNAWSHYAFTRSGSTFRIFLNGALVWTSGTIAGSLGTTARSAFIGKAAGATELFPGGYLSSTRLVNGTAVYTSSFTPPVSPLTAITNTKLLLGYTNAGIVDSTAKNVLETVGNAQISTTQSKFGGSSMYFDGTGDRLYFADGKAYVNGTEPFTLECWVYLGGTPNYWTIFGSSSSNGLLFTVQNLTTIIVNPSGLGNTVSGTTSLTAGTWFHLALTRNSANRFDIWVNGASIGNATSTQSFGTPTMFVIGAADNSGGQQFNGYLDDVRISKFCRYTGTFTPQTSQWQDQ